MKDFLFGVVSGCAVGSLILIVINLLGAALAWFQDKLEEPDEKKNP